MLGLCAVALPQPSSLVTLGSAGTLTVIYWTTRHALTSPPETSPNVPVIVRQKGVNECKLMDWGLIPHWAADPSIGNRMINARAETLTELPSFKSLVNGGRCIIPADGFYEWRKEGKGPDVGSSQKQGAFRLCRTVGRMAQTRRKAVESFTIITTEPNELLRSIHNRMPVILRPEDEEQWLEVSRIPFTKAKSLLRPYPDESMEAHDVSPIVNSAKYDGPECIQPVLDDDMTPGGQLSLL